MADPIQPKYGPPFDPNSMSGSGSDPNSGADLSYLVPNVNVAWSSPGSFNDDPPSSGTPSTKPQAPQDIPECGPISIDLSTLMSALTSMLGSVRTVVDDFTSLRNNFLSNKDDIYGQNSTYISTDAGGAGGSFGTGVSTGTTYNSPVQSAAQAFAASNNPAQENALLQIGNTLEAVGQYIATLDRSGQFYGEADRKAMFPNTPAPPS